jgi:hypothetical protein
MANLSNVSSLAGVASGITGGLQNAGVVQQMMQNQDKAARDAAEAPLRTKLLETQTKAADLAVEGSQLDVAEKRRRLDALKRPWNPAAGPLFQRMAPEEQLMHMENVKAFLGGKDPSTLTMADQEAFSQAMATDLKLFDAEKPVLLGVATREEATALKNYSDAMKAGAPPEKVAALAQIATDAKAKTQGLTGNLDKMRGSIEVQNWIKENEGILKDNKTLQMIAQIGLIDGKLDGVKDILKVIETNKAKDIPNTAFESFYAGKLADVKAGRIQADQGAWAKEWEGIIKDKGNVIKDVTTTDASGETVVQTSVINKDGVVTKVLGQGKKYKEGAEKTSPQSLRYKEWIQDLKYANMPFDEFVAAEDRAKISGSKFDKKNPYNPAWAAKTETPGAPAKRPLTPANFISPFADLPSATSASSRPQSPLAGKPPGRYKVNGRVVSWDGNKEI